MFIIAAAVKTRQIDIRKNAGTTPNRDYFAAGAIGRSAQQG